MSYSILYRPAFIKCSDGRFIPFYENGDSNAFEVNRNRRARDWNTCGSLFVKKGGDIATEAEMLQQVASYEADGSLQKNGKWLGGIETQRLIKSACKSAFSFEELSFYGLQVVFKQYVPEKNAYRALGKTSSEKEFFSLREQFSKEDYFLKLQGTEEQLRTLLASKKKVVSKKEPPVFFVVTLDGIYGCTKLTKTHLKYVYGPENGKKFKNEGSARNWAEKLGRRLKGHVFSVKEIKNINYNG